MPLDTQELTVALIVGAVFLAAICIIAGLEADTRRRRLKAE
jgi:hypothetical protein